MNLISLSAAVLIKYISRHEEIVIVFRVKDKYKVFDFCGGKPARVHITKSVIENPKVPPMFCMLLRKHLETESLIYVRTDWKEYCSLILRQ